MSRNLLAIFIYSYFKKYKVAKLCSVSSTSYLILQNSILPSSNFPNADCDIFSIFAQFSDGRPRHHSFPAVQHPREDETQNRVLTFIKELSKPKKNIYFRLYRVLFKIVCVIHSPLIDFQFAQCSIKCSILKNSLNHLIRGKAHCPSQQKFKSTICIHHLYNESFFCSITPSAPMCSCPSS